MNMLRPSALPQSTHAANHQVPLGEKQSRENCSLLKKAS